MIRLVMWLLVATAALSAQPVSKAELLKLTDQVEAAIQGGDWGEAAKLSRSLRAAVEASRNQSMAADGNELANSILTWLPADTETVVVGQQPFAIAAPDNTRIPSALDGAHSYLLGLLSAAEKQTLIKKLVGRTVRLAAMGARRFGESTAKDTVDRGRPVLLGMIPYQGCALYAFTEPVPETMLSRTFDESIMGHRVWISAGSQDSSPNTATYFVSLLESNSILVCNHREFLREFVSRMGLPQRARALPADLPEWKQVDRSAPVWAICHYSGNNVFVASLFQPGKNLHVRGVTLAFGLKSGAVKARVMSDLDPWSEFVNSPDFRGAAKSLEAERGVWELSLDGKPEVALITVFVLMSAVGFIILV